MLFADFMLNAWLAGTIVAIVAPIGGFFVVLRGNAFAAHAIPEAAFAGAAGAVLIGVDTLFGLGVAAAVAALAIGVTAGRLRHDALTALVMTFLLALGTLFLSWTSTYTQQVYALLFGETLGVSNNGIGITMMIGAIVLIALTVLYRPLLLTSVLPEVATARGISRRGIEIAFMLVLALATTAAVPVVGALLVFSLTIGPPAAAMQLVRRPLPAITLSVVFGLAA
ncbi:MAG TPA: metal ABC transporter permease, partial [Marmoricola sp.]|nr:metal ABC transporter permease [Marmoricola sp.]